MKSTANHGLVLFGVAAVVGAVVAYPTVSKATVFRQYTAAICSFQGNAAPGDPAYNNARPAFGVVDGTVYNNRVVPDPGPFGIVPDSAELVMSCPLVEDESVHTKGGTVVYATLDQRPDTWWSVLQACATYDSSLGQTCTSFNQIGPATGVKSYSIVPASSVWQDSTNYGYLYIQLGSKLLSTATMNTFKGFWVSHS